MSQHVADINLAPIIVYRGDQSNFVASNIEDREFSHLVGVRKFFAELHEILKPAFTHNRVPPRERRLSIWMPLDKVVQTLPCDDMHESAENGRNLARWEARSAVES